MKNLSDENLIELIRQNSHQAFKVFIERYEKKVANTVINMLGNGYIADDVGQEVFIRFYNNINQFKGKSSVGTYLTRIAINLSINELKKQKIKKSRFVFWGANNDNENDKLNEIADPSIFTRKAEYTDIVNKAFQKIEPKLKIVIILRFIEGHDTRETSEILEIPQGTVLSRLSRGMQKLKEILVKEGYEP